LQSRRQALSPRKAALKQPGRASNFVPPYWMVSRTLKKMGTYMLAVERRRQDFLLTGEFSGTVAA
jgi:hypothetical protein